MNARVEQQRPRANRTVGTTWPLERVLFAMSGTVTLVSVLLAAAISPWWLLLDRLRRRQPACVRRVWRLRRLARIAARVRPRERERAMSAATVQLGPIGRLGRYAATHARAVAIAWVVVAVGLGFLAPRVETALSGAGWEATGSDSVAARSLIQQHFAGNASTGLMIVLHSPSLRSSDACLRRRHRQDRGTRRRPTRPSRASRCRPPGSRSAATATPRS